VKKSIGILGGMGPLATVKAYELFIRLTKAECDNDHIPILVFGDSTIPDRTGAICDGCESPAPTVKKDLAIIDELGIDLVFIPCNTCHYYYDELQEGTKAEIVNMIRVTADYVQDNYKEMDCYVLGTKGTVEGKIYDRYLESSGNFRTLSAEEQETVMNSIYSIKERGPDHENVGNMVNMIRQKTSDRESVFILGCTELSVIKEELEAALPKAHFVDAMEVTVREIIKKLGYEVIGDR